MATESCFLHTPVGWLEIRADAAGVTAIRFLDAAPLRSAFAVTYPHLKEAYKQIGEYFRGERSRFTLKLNPQGTDVQRQVWERLANVPFGTTITYGELANDLVKAGARTNCVNQQNPLPIVVPCHRVVGTDEELVGFGAGVAIKEKLLDIEGVGRGR